MNNVINEIKDLANKVIDLDLRMSEEDTRNLKDILSILGYDVSNLGSNFPLILIAIRECINPN